MSVTFPFFLRAQVAQDGFAAFDKLERRAEESASRTRSAFESNFAEIQKITRQALSMPRTASGGLDINVGQYREAAAAAQTHALALREVAQAAERAAIASGDTSQATHLYVQAARAAATEGEANARAAQQQVAAMERLQGALGSVASKTTTAATQQHALARSFGAVNDNSRAARASQVNLGQQLNDVVVGLASGLLDQVMKGKMDPNAAFDRASKMDFSGLDINQDQYVSAIRDIVSSRAKDKTADEILKTLSTGKLSEFFRKDPKGGSDKAAALADFARDATDKISTINEAFDDQPRLIDRAAQAARDLDSIIADLERRKPAGFEAMIEQATAAKATIQEGVLRPFKEYVAAGAEGLSIDRIRLVGRDAEAEAMRDILALQKEMGPLSRDQVAAVLRTVQGGYFDLLGEVTNLTGKALQDQSNIVSIGSGAASPFDAPAPASSAPSSANDTAASVVGAVGSLQQLIRESMRRSSRGNCSVQSQPSWTRTASTMPTQYTSMCPVRWPESSGMPKDGR